MGAFLATAKRPAPVEGQSDISENPLFPPNPSLSQAGANPPLKRRRIEPHNDPVFPTVSAIPTAPFSAPTTSPTEPSVNREELSRQTIPRPKRVKFRYRSYALFLAYSGDKYHGMQINPGVVTIEKLVMSALHAAKIITDFELGHPSRIKLMRSARTDKGVSAAIQCVSFTALETEANGLKHDRPAAVDRLNNHLPEDVRAFGLLRSTQGFNARCDCDKRRYEYLFPLRLLGGPNAPQTDSINPTGSDARLAKLNRILKNYEGSHCFGNFTEGPVSSKDSLRRQMLSVKCVESVLPPGSGIYYVVVEILGQSFLLHQIRKMIGLALIVYHQHIPKESIQVALSPDVQFATPKAPAEGLLLDKLYFDRYNNRFNNTLEVPIGDDTFYNSRREFKLHHIYKHIAMKERHNHVLEAWVKSCKHRMSIKPEEVLKLHQNFISTAKGKEEQRRAFVASLYPIKTSVEAFMDSKSADESCRAADSLCNKFNDRFGTKATFLVRAPGRVILIGEHLDYNGLPVIGAAMAQGTLIAGCQDATTAIVVEHLEDAVYSGGSISTDGNLKPNCHNVEVNNRDQRWLQYMSWGVKALSTTVKTRGYTPGGGRILVSGNLPRAGGLASSSSLVSASVLSAVRMSRRRLPREELASIAARGEREGTHTRGASVDHVISMCAIKGHVLKVSFLPKVEVEHFKWLEGVRLFVIDSHVKAEKGIDEVKKLFSLRGAECRIGAALLARRLGLKSFSTIASPGQLLSQVQRSKELQISTIADFIKVFPSVMHTHETLSLDQIRTELAVNEAELRNRFLMDVDATEFKVGLRMTHVWQEAMRVEKFAEILQNPSLSDSDKIQELGNVMNDGHRSLQTLFESSVPEVDKLIEACRLNGAAGSRMTGAGWGGHTVNLVKSDSASHFLSCMSQLVGKDSITEVLPWSGACVFAIHTN